MTIAINPNNLLVFGMTPHSHRRQALAWLRRSRGARVLWLLIGVWLLNAVDLICTLLALEHCLSLPRLLDSFAEANPIAARVLALGPSAILVYKIALVGGGSVTLVRYRRRLLVEVASGALLAVYALVAVQWYVCLQELELARRLALNLTNCSG